MLKRSKPLKRGTSQLTRTAPLKKVSPGRPAKHAAKMKQHYASPEYKAARAEAMERSGGRCEGYHVFPTFQLLLPGEQHPRAAGEAKRCHQTEALEFHETEYDCKLGIVRSIKGYMLCESDHWYIEATRHSTRRRRRGGSA